MRNKVVLNLFLFVIILIVKVCLMLDLWLIKNWYINVKYIFYRLKYFEFF